MVSEAEMLQAVRRLDCSLLTLRNKSRGLPRITQSKISRGESIQSHQASVRGGLRIFGSVSMKIVDNVVEVTIYE
jgi:hypothetical protein